MKTIPIPLLLLLTLFSSLGVVNINSKSNVIWSTKQSLVRVSHPQDNDHVYACTGFIIDTAKGWAITAKHCVVDDDDNLVEDLSVDGLPTEVVKSTDSLAMVKVRAMLGPPLDLRKSKLDNTEEVIAIGYGYGSLMTIIRHIATSEPDFEPKRDLVLDGPLVPGMSGGPVVDLDGKVVGIVQRNYPRDLLSIICGVKEIEQFIKSK